MVNICMNDMSSNIFYIQDKIMKIKELINDLDWIIIKLKLIEENEPDVEVEIEVAEEYTITKFWNIKRVNYSVKDPVDYIDIPHYYEIETMSSC